jgi:hypothetical protein
MIVEGLFLHQEVEREVKTTKCIAIAVHLVGMLIEGVEVKPASLGVLAVWQVEVEVDVGAFPLL